MRNTRALCRLGPWTHESTKALDSRGQELCCELMDHPRKSGSSLPLHVVGSTVPTEQALNLQSFSGTWSTPVFAEDPPAVRTSSPRVGCSVQMMELLDSCTSAPEDHVEESGCCPDQAALELQGSPHPAPQELRLDLPPSGVVNSLVSLRGPSPLPLTTTISSL